MKSGPTLALALGVSVCALGQTPIRLKTGILDPGQRHEHAAPVPGKRTAHYIIQFGAYPGPEIRRELARRRIRVLDYVPDFALMVSSGPDADLSGLDVRFVGPLPAAAKLSPELGTRNSPAYLVVFHSDVDMDAARELAVERGFVIHENPGLLPGHLVMSGGWREVNELAEADEVAYVLPARADLAFGRSVKGCSGAVTEAGPVGEYTSVGPGWTADPGGGAALKYSIQSLSPALDTAVARQEFQRAFREWAKYGNVTFSESANAGGSRTIAVLSSRRAHGDPYPFDGRGGSLAHAFYPAPPNNEPIAGDIHLDADEDWQAGATDLFSVTLHELGHALGLGHSDDPDSVMYAYYQTSSGLTGDDIAAIRKLYGIPGGDSDPPPGGGGDPGTPDKPPSTSDNVSPGLRVTYPAMTLVSTYAPNIVVAGTATDNIGVASVRWFTSSGYAGVAEGTSSWKASIPLLSGTNLLKITASDVAGNSSWRSITVVRR